MRLQTHQPFGVYCEHYDSLLIHLNSSKTELRKAGISYDKQN
jgi:hypothetical protein